MGYESVKELEKNKVELNFSMAKDAFDAAIDRVFRRRASKINVPGFRKGKAPRNIIEKMYGKGVFFEDAINDLLPAAYSEALKESGVKVVSQPEFEIANIDENGVQMKAVVYVEPEVALKSYEGFAVDRITTPVTDEMVQAELERVQERNARETTVTDRAAQKGDLVVIDFEGSVDGNAFDGGKAKGHTLELGSGSFIPGFEDQICGHQTGDVFDVEVTFPEDYHEASLAGKAAVFHTTLKEIRLKELPALDDEFAKDVSEFNTLDEYKADIRSKMEARNAKTADDAMMERLYELLIDNMEVDIPEPMIDTEVENIIRDRDYSLRQNGLKLEDYLKYMGTTLDDMRAQSRPAAEKQVKLRLALEKIIELEGIDCTEEDINAECQVIADAYTLELEKIKSSIDMDLLRGDLKRRKAAELVKAKAVITEKTAEEAAAAEAPKAE